MQNNKECPVCNSELIQVKALDNDLEITVEDSVCLNCDYCKSGEVK